MKRAAFLSLFLLLAGCMRQQEAVAPAPKPFSEMSFVEQCANMIEMTGNPYATPGQKAAVYEMARNKGCMGPPQPQTVIVR